MKVYYDDEVDALYLKFGDETPEGVIEISDGVNIDTTSEEKIVGIEILNASKKIDLKTILSYSLEFEGEPANYQCRIIRNHERQGDRMSREKQEVSDEHPKEDSLESPPLDKDGLPPDCVFCGGVASVVYCNRCENWMCQECYDEHDC